MRSALTPPIQCYLEHYRPQLLGESQDGETRKEGSEAQDHLWISWRGEPLAETGVYASVTGRTRAAFGTPIPPHRFRDSAATSLGEADPELVWLAPALLHHADRRIAEKHNYDQARDSRAVGLWQERVRAERREVLNKTRRSDPLRGQD